jgi:hypothetical protein
MKRVFNLQKWIVMMFFLLFEWGYWGWGYWGYCNRVLTARTTRTGSLRETFPVVDINLRSSAEVECVVIRFELGDISEHPHFGGLGGQVGGWLRVRSRGKGSGRGDSLRRRRRCNHPPLGRAGYGSYANNSEKTRMKRAELLTCTTREIVVPLTAVSVAEGTLV